MSALAIEVTRDAADRDGGEIRESLLGTSLPAAIARGRAELDAHHRPRDRVTLHLDYRADLAPGDLIDVLEPQGGHHWRAIILGIDHTWDGDTATTTLDLSRPREARA